MRIYLSISANMAGAANQLKTIFGAAGHDLLGAFLDTLDFRIGENWRAALEKQLRAADAYVFVIDQDSSGRRFLPWEGSVALEQSWSREGVQLISVLIDAAESPAFLRDCFTVRAVSGGDWTQTANLVLEALTENKKPSPEHLSSIAKTQQAEQQQRLTEITSVAKTFESSVEEQEKQVEWLLKQVDQARQDNSSSLELAELNVKLADALKAVGRHEEAINPLESALAILDGIGRNQQAVRVQMNIARLLGHLGRDQEALSLWQSALERSTRAEGPDSLTVLLIHGALATTYTKLGMMPEAGSHRDALHTGIRKGLSRFLKSVPIIGRWLSDASDDTTTSTDSTGKPGIKGGG